MQDLFTKSGTWPRRLHFIADSGTSFDEHYNDAFAQVFALGYDTILSLGADMPTLPKSVIVEGFRSLQNLCRQPQGGMVISPDQEMGVSLIGWTRDTNMNHSGIFYNPSGLTVLPAYIEKARNLNLPALMISAVPDIDTMADLHHHITVMQAIAYCARFQDLSVPYRTIAALKELGYDDIRIPPNELRDTRELIDVPKETP
jgi:glycosyltransferase A (GT-A) superfamily protein (DUF2064 family)